MAAITKQQLTDAATDAQTLADVANGGATDPNPGHPDGTVTSRLGTTYPNIGKFLQDMADTIDQGEVTQLVESAIAQSEILLTQTNLYTTTALAAMTAALTAAGLPPVDGTLTMAGTEPNGLWIDIPGTVEAREVKVRDTTTPANAKDTSLSNWLPGSWWLAPKVCRQADGTEKWSAQNTFLRSETFGNASWTKTNASITGPDAAGLFTMTATSTTAQISQNYVAQKDLNYATWWIVAAGTAGFARVSADALVGYVNLTTGAVTNVSAGYSVQAFNTDENGDPLASGEWRILASHNSGSTGAAGHALNACDAAGSTAVTNGRTIKIRRAGRTQGVLQVAYLATTTTVRYGAPYDYTHGERLVLIEAAAITHRGLWTEDMTKAEWVKSGSPAVALTGLSPLGNACSRVTVGAVNDTIIQALTNAATTWIFQCRIKRINGTGRVWMTCDNGTNWTEILVDATDFAAPYLKGTAANPAWGFKFETAGDIFDISLADLAQSAILCTPMVIGDTSLVRTQDSFNPSAFPTADTQTFYVDGYSSPDTSAFSFGLTGAGGRFALLNSTNGAQLWNQINDTVTTWTSIIGDAAPSKRLQGTMRLKANAHLASFNGVGAMLDHRPNAVTLTTLSSGTGAGMVWLRRLAVIPRDYGAHHLETWHQDNADKDAGYYDDILVSPWGYTADNAIQRAPVLTVLFENESKVVGWVSNLDRYVTASGGSGEMPARIPRREFTFNKVTKLFDPIGDPIVFLQAANWTASKGNIQDTVYWVQKQGIHKGRLHVIYSQLDSANGSISPTDWRPMYYAYTDDRVHLSDPIKILDAGNGTYTLADPSGRGIELPADHPSGYGGRFIATYYSGDSGGDAGIMGTGVVIKDFPDDPYDGWRHVQVSGVGTDEANLELLPDGTLYMTIRSEIGGIRDWAKSYDGGDSWPDHGAITGSEFIPVSMGLVNLDPLGGRNGPKGAPCLIGVRQSPPIQTRTKLTFELLIGDGPLEPSGEQYTPLGFHYGSGYCSPYLCNDGTVLLAYETSPSHNLNVDGSIRLGAFNPGFV